MQEIKDMLFDLEHMVEKLKVYSTENWQWDIIQHIYNIISKLDDYDFNSYCESNEKI